MNVRYFKEGKLYRNLLFGRDVLSIRHEIHLISEAKGDGFVLQYKYEKRRDMLTYT